jgi:hypothetical protein
MVILMEISQLVWNENTIEHIARHNVLIEEVEEVCFGQPVACESGVSLQTGVCVSVRLDV